MWEVAKNLVSPCNDFVTLVFGRGRAEGRRRGERKEGKAESGRKERGEEERSYVYDS
jgi:hypothetical protein